MENKKFTVYYSETRKQLLVMLGLPLLIIGLIVSVLLSLNEPDDTTVLIVIFSGMGLLIAGILYAALKLIMVPTEIEITDDGIHFHILKGNPLYGNTSWFCPWSNISNAAPFEYNGAFSFRFKYRIPNHDFLLNLKGAENKNPTPEFWLEISERIKNFNSETENKGIQVTSKGFYEGPFADLIAYLIIIMLVGFPILAIFAGGERKFQVFARMSTIYIFGIPYLIAWRKNKKKK